MLNDLVTFSQWFFLFYFIGLNLSYMLLNFAAIVNVYNYMSEKTLANIPGIDSDVMPPVSLIVPAYNEEATITQSILALMQLEYPQYEIIVINDGSNDNTLKTLKRDMKLRTFPEAYRRRLETKPINRIYHSTEYQNIRVIDKHNGGKSDALNAGINISRYPLVCVVDADSILQRDSLKRVVQPFMFDNRTVVSGGSVRVVNGSTVSHGYIKDAVTPKKILPLIQVVEYLRAFLFGRLGWSPLNALLIVSGAFGVFHKETLISVGGYMADTIGEDMELIVRIHRKLRGEGKEYRITFVPDPICWTEAPEDLASLAGQRIRWQRGLCESLFKNISLFMNPRAGAVGLLAFPFMFIFEWAGPIIEVFGFIMILIGYLTDQINLDIFLLLIAVAIIFGMTLSLTALLLEEISFHLYKKPSDLFRLFMAAVIENFGYRQMNSIFRIIGFYRWLFNVRTSWGVMKRKGADL